MICYVTNTERTCALEKRILATEIFLSIASAVSSFLVNQVQNTRVFFCLDPIGHDETLDQNLSQTSYIIICRSTVCPDFG